jgi:hypothetical protein
MSSTGSLRRKFGLGSLSRSSSKASTGSTAGKLWRTLSKSERPSKPPGSSGSASGSRESTPSSSFSKAGLRRALSTPDNNKNNQYARMGGGSERRRKLSHEDVHDIASLQSSPFTSSSIHTRKPLEPIIASPPTEEQVAGNSSISRKKSKRFLSEG